METINLFLSTAQLRKLHTGHAFQLSASQLHAGDGRHQVAIQLSKSHYNRLLKNVERDKGFRFTPAIIQGGALWDSVKGAFQKIGQYASHAGHAVEAVKQVVPRHVAKSAARRAASYVSKHAPRASWIRLWMLHMITTSRGDVSQRAAKRLTHAWRI